MGHLLLGAGEAAHPLILLQDEASTFLPLEWEPALMIHLTKQMWVLQGWQNLEVMA